MSIQEFVAPHSLSEAKGLLSDGAIASVLAGGTDLLVGVRLGTRSPERVVDLKKFLSSQRLTLMLKQCRLALRHLLFRFCMTVMSPLFFLGSLRRLT